MLWNYCRAGWTRPRRTCRRCCTMAPWPLWRRAPVRSPRASCRNPDLIPRAPLKSLVDGFQGPMWKPVLNCARRFRRRPRRWAAAHVGSTRAAAARRGETHVRAAAPGEDSPFEFQGEFLCGIPSNNPSSTPPHTPSSHPILYYPQQPSYPILPPEAMRSGSAGGGFSGEARTSQLQNSSTPEA